MFSSVRNKAKLSVEILAQLTVARKEKAFPLSLQQLSSNYFCLINWMLPAKFITDCGASAALLKRLAVTLTQN